eukprot:Sspe_Gene.35925::Locus_17397_Transcript_1_1_Confidence_1.000_Length_2653::g.35925::m.35925
MDDADTSTTIPYIPHPHALNHLARAEAKARQEITKKETSALARLNDAMLEEVEERLREVVRLKELAIQHRRALAVERTKLVNQQVRLRAKIDDEWLRGFERIAYLDFPEAMRRLRKTQGTTPSSPALRTAHGPGHFAATQLACYPKGKPPQFFRTF